ncbi:nuclear transport factor 2 family protein [Citrobacter sp. RHB25-C09]|uniref:nuclear transport factor 2 family protein n=1 Tax=Citrobacter TaxID=544 RepID=UPI0015EF9F8D|nr:nuclear transport factor 2 family protein [Citrobacter sp. RHB25-C09]QMI04923.1 nuclear transport factor 2 family protein [Citrobacter sp. RHB25-C09]
MSLSLPNAISKYFTISNGADIVDIKHCFTTDAIVLDEGKTYQGHEAIEAWQRTAQSEFDYSVEPIEVFTEGDRVIVTSNVVGNFPGSPVVLKHAFGLVDDKIRILEIV